MKLEEIGFYTLEDMRAAYSSMKSPLWRCELILTDACNFKCSYCRGLRSDIAGTTPLNEAMGVVDYWISEKLRNVRFSGGEPLLYKGLIPLVRRCKEGFVYRIAVSSNGSLPTHYYQELIDAGVNDFSISLDACCAEDGDKMAGGIKGAWDKVVSNIRYVAERVYTTVGVVLTEDNSAALNETIEFAHSLGVADIRVIPAAQRGKTLQAPKCSKEILDAHPILRYRVNNIAEGRDGRGISDRDFNMCPLALDDMAVANGRHFPCIIYMREQGDAIGLVGKNTRKDRRNWFLQHDTKKDPICKNNCLDVCVDYNNKWVEIND